MAERDGFELGRRRFGAHQVLKLLALKDPLNRSQPIRPFRMARRRQMIETGRMGNKERRHSQNLVVCGAKWKCRSTAELRQSNLADAVGSLNHLAFESRGTGRKVLGKEPRNRNAGLGIGSGA